MRRLVVTAISLMLLVVTATQVAPAAASAPCGHPPRPGYAYNWPIRPFETQHPIRGAFGDPRIVSVYLPFGWTASYQPGGHSFHNGVDIGADPGTPVYPVVSGRVARANQGQIVVRTADGRSFQYYHLTRAPAVQLGRCVISRHTVLGWINEKWGHVHMAEIDGSVVHNPLDRGHLEPYRDWTRPTATGLYVGDGTLPHKLDGHALGPGDTLAVAAAEPPALTMAGHWYGLPQTPALVQWRLIHGGRWSAWSISADFRHTQPPPSAFWDVYGAGTYQNCPQFDGHNYLGTPGRYLFRLRIHPNLLAPGAYRIQVRVSDVRGNRSTITWPLRIVH